MAVKQNLDLIRKRYKAVNAHNWDRFQECYAKSIVWKDPGLPSAIKGSLAVRKRLEALTAAFPDLHWKLGRIFGQDNLVCAEFTFTGTHQTKFYDERNMNMIPATNKKVTIKASGVYKLLKGKIVDSVIYFDYGMLLTGR